MKNYLLFEGFQRIHFGKMLLLVLMLVFVSGCGGAGSEIPAFLTDLTPVTGTVTLKGEPLVGASIMFYPQEGQLETRMAGASTNELGVFELVTPVSGMDPSKTKGVASGKYKVSISKIVKPDGSAIPAGMDEATAMAEGAAESLPAKYSSLEETELTADVTPGEAVEINFDLK